MKFANKILNSMSEEQIVLFQTAKLKRQLKYCYNNSKYYRNKFKAIGLHPCDINTLDDFRRIPIFMTKDEERESQKRSLKKYGHPFGMHLCSKIEDIELASTTSGTTGMPTFTYTFSRRDINGPIAELWAFLFKYVNVQAGDRVLFAHSLGVSSTSMILWGIRKAQAIPIDVDVGRGIDTILQFAALSKAVCALMTPSLADTLIKVAKESIGKEIRELGIRYLFLCGEPGAGIENKRRNYENSFGAKVFDYWAPGAIGFGLSCDCSDYHGLHCYAPDYNLFQDDIVDPASKNPIEIVDGAIGELVHTSLDRDACPMVRYAYGDIAQVFTKECPGCGFKGKRLKFIGRADDMMIVKGSKIYPTAIKEIISLFIPRVTGSIRIVIKQPLPRVSPPIHLKIEHAAGMEQHQLVELEMNIKRELYKRLKATFEFSWVPPNTLVDSDLKTSLFLRL